MTDTQVKDSEYYRLLDELNEIVCDNCKQTILSSGPHKGDLCLTCVNELAPYYNWPSGAHINTINVHQKQYYKRVQRGRVCIYDTFSGCLQKIDFDSVN